MILKTLFASALFLFLSTGLGAQDKVQLLNGKIVEGEVTSTADEMVTVKVTNKKGKVYDTYLENYRVFSIVNKDGVETVIYKQDSTIGNFLAPPEMKYYMYGEQDADKNYRPLGTMLLGASLGFGLSLYDTYSFKSDSLLGVQKGFFKGDPGLVHLVFPLVYTIGAGMIRTQLDIKNVTDRNNLSSENYIQGFARVARFKRTMRALLFSCAGSILGLGSYYIFK